jgi:hypothetical protein
MACKMALAALALISGSGCGGVGAEEYTVAIGGTGGTAFAGTCLLVTADGITRHDASGIVPLTLEFSGDLISCAIQRKEAAGTLHLVIMRPDGRPVAESSANQPFGVVMAAGR